MLFDGAREENLELGLAGRDLFSRDPLTIQR